MKKQRSINTRDGREKQIRLEVWICPGRFAIQPALPTAAWRWLWFRAFDNQQEKAA